MKKLAIVSSYNELCGNASYTESLRQEFAKYYDVKVFALNSNLNKLHPALVNKYLAKIANQLEQFDFVNIQFEAILYGNNPKAIYKNFKLLARASKNLIVTLHRYDPKLTFSFKKTLWELVRCGVKSCLRNLYRNAWINFQNTPLRVIKYCKNRKAAIIAHTKRDRLLIQASHDYNYVYDHPLSFLSKEAINAYKTNANKQNFLKKYGLTKERVCIGAFGFISKYKGHHTIIKALNHLPSNYVLLVFGSQHPLSIMQHTEIDPYLAELIELLSLNSALKERVHFCGSLGNDDFIKALLCCDFVVLPYLEVNQAGSGIASLALEVSAKAIFSQNLTFLELAKYAPNCFKMFSIGNYLELANAICQYTADNSLALENYYKNYNIHTSIKLYRDIFENRLAKKRDTEIYAEKN